MKVTPAQFYLDLIEQAALSMEYRQILHTLKHENDGLSGMKMLRMARRMAEILGALKEAKKLHNVRDNTMFRQAMEQQQASRGIPRTIYLGKER